MKTKSKNRHCNGTTFTKGHRKIDTTVSGDEPERECPVGIRVRRHILDIPRQIAKNQLRLRPRATECKWSDQCENKIADIERISDLLNAFQAHNCGAKMEVSGCSRKGLCTILRAQCKKCGFVVDKVMTSECKKQSDVPGPPSGNMNQRLALAAAKTKAGPNDLACILAALSSESGI